LSHLPLFFFKSRCSFLSFPFLAIYVSPEAFFLAFPFPATELDRCSYFPDFDLDPFILLIPSRGLSRCARPFPVSPCEKRDRCRGVRPLTVSPSHCAALRDPLRLWPSTAHVTHGCGACFLRFLFPTVRPRSSTPSGFTWQRDR